MTAGLRAAMDDVRRFVAVLAARVRDAHAARVWLGHSSWELYCDAEFGISRAQEYRLLTLPAPAIHGAVAAGAASGTRDQPPSRPDRGRHHRGEHMIDLLRQVARGSKIPATALHSVSQA
jgi:hypothetical protein